MPAMHQIPRQEFFCRRENDPSKACEKDYTDARTQTCSGYGVGKITAAFKMILGSHTERNQKWKELAYTRETGITDLSFF